MDTSFLVRNTAQVSCVNDPVEHRAPIGVVVCAGPPGVTERLRASSTGAAVTTAETVLLARAALAGWSQWPQRHSMPLPPDQVVVFLGSRAVHDLSLTFGHPGLAPTARLIAAELISNAVEHARTDLDVVLSVRGDVLHLGVYDRHPGLPEVAPGEPWHPDRLRGRRGAGLGLVDAAATAWGAMPWAGGKLVWATLALDGRPAR